ncbi:hypothetical protein DPMN_016047 [Dreissena polymorpha]|uniref:Uncharacterized protein n=1 Tax=Dreissena polymorpha TaxID=45954 RepID=A0A9D4N8Y7_DREPO|nr:hypothetical protein DPMN_016047 [Dreissena polymorpha]
MLEPSTGKTPAVIFVVIYAVELLGIVVFQLCLPSMARTCYPVGSLSENSCSPSSPSEYKHRQKQNSAQFTFISQFVCVLLGIVGVS